MDVIKPEAKSPFSIMENTQIIHIVVEIVLMIGLVFYYNAKLKGIVGYIEDLAQQLEEKENRIQKLENTIQQMSVALTQTIQKVSYLAIQQDNREIKETKKTKEPKVNKKHTTPKVVPNQEPKPTATPTPKPAPKPEMPSDEEESEEETEEVVEEVQVNSTSSPNGVPVKKPALSMFKEDTEENEENEENEDDIDDEIREELNELENKVVRNDNLKKQT